MSNMSNEEITLLSNSFSRAMMLGVDKLQTPEQRKAVASLHREFCEARRKQDITAMRQKRERLNEFIIQTNTP